jgi:kynurenine formamidase
MTTNWGRWGADDQRGTLNLITEEKRLRALGLPATGQVFSLGQPIQSAGVPMVKDGARGFFIRPMHFMLYDGGDEAGGYPTRGDCYFSSEDFLALRIHGTTTHIDGLAHGWKHGQMYNGFDATCVSSFGAGKLGIENVEHIVTRGLLFDVAASLGVDHLEEGYAITVDDLKNCPTPPVEPGDAVLIRTGWYNVFFSDPDRYDGAWPGLSTEAAVWLADQDVVILGSDNVGVEVLGSDLATAGFACPVHGIVLRDYGIYLLELMVLEELAAAGVTEFLFMLAPLKVSGGTGSPVNPLAIA